jgi:hypothetical protein
VRIRVVKSTKHKFCNNKELKETRSEIIMVRLDYWKNELRKFKSSSKRYKEIMSYVKRMDKELASRVKVKKSKK